MRLRLHEHPEMMPLFITPFLGPELFPAEVYSDEALAAVFA